MFNPMEQRENLLSLESDVAFVTLRYWRFSLSIMDIMGNPSNQPAFKKGTTFRPPSIGAGRPRLSAVNVLHSHGQPGALWTPGQTW